MVCRMDQGCLGKVKTVFLGAKEGRSIVALTASQVCKDPFIRYQSTQLFPQKRIGAGIQKRSSCIDHITVIACRSGCFEQQVQVSAFCIIKGMPVFTDSGTIHSDQRSPAYRTY